MAINQEGILKGTPTTWGPVIREEILSTSPTSTSLTVSVTHSKNDPETQEYRVTHREHFPVCSLALVMVEFGNGEERRYVEPVFLTEFGLQTPFQYRSTVFFIMDDVENLSIRILS